MIKYQDLSYDSSIEHILYITIATVNHIICMYKLNCRRQGLRINSTLGAQSVV